MHIAFFPHSTASITCAQRPQVYRLIGAPLFFGSCRPLLRLFDYDNDPQHIVVDLSDTSITDLSGVTALNEVGKRYHVSDRHRRLTPSVPPSVRNLRLGGRPLPQAASFQAVIMQSDLHVEPSHDLPPPLVAAQETGGKTVTVVGLDEASRAVVRRCPGHSSHLLIDGIHVRPRCQLPSCC